MPMYETLVRKHTATLCALVLLSVLWTLPLGLRDPIAEAAEVEDEQWSFRFNNLSVAEVLTQLSQKTGIEIITNRPPDEKQVNKSYEDHTVEEIIRDVFRGANYTLVWNYSDTGIESIGIHFFDQGSSSRDRLSSGSRYNPRSTAVDRDSPTSRQRPSRRVVRPRRPSTSRTASRRPPPAEIDEDDEDYDEDEEDDEDYDEDEE